MELVPSLELIVKSTRIQMRKVWCGLCLLTGWPLRISKLEIADQIHK